MCSKNCAFFGLIIIIYGFLQVNSLLEYKNIKCSMLDENFVRFEYCHLKSVNRSYKYMSLKAKIFQLPITNFKLNFVWLRNNNGFKPFLFNASVDGCRLLGTAKAKRNIAANYFFNTIEPFSNLNHTCPLNHDIIVEKLPTSYWEHQIALLAMPLGDYAAYTGWYNSGIKRAEVKIYISIS